jgi:hypothetical protein
VTSPRQPPPAEASTIGGGFATHTCPVPVKPTLQAQVLVPGPLIVQVALGSQPPLAVVQGLTAVQTPPSPLYPGLQAQVAVFGPVDVHSAVAAQPPLLTAHASIPVHVVPLPV